MTRRRRGTPEQAITDINAAMARLARGRPNRSSGALTATSLAAEAGMSRKQLYHYFGNHPTLAASWRQITADHAASDTATGDAASAARIRDLEQRLELWKMLAAVARAEAERESEFNAALRAENDQLRATQTGGQVARLRPIPAVTNR